MASVASAHLDAQLLQAPCCGQLLHEGPSSWLAAADGHTAQAGQLQQRRQRLQAVTCQWQQQLQAA